MPDQPDLLLFLSDQHTARLMGCAGDAVVETPNLDALSGDGCRFSAAITPCPLCVPARFALLSGIMPHRTGVLGNGDIMPSEIATVAHALGAAGYETVLCGRMHFCGQDQRHGFERRIMGDFTPCLPGRGGARRADLGPYVETPAGKWERIVGGGQDSPVLAYDRAVIAAAVDEIRRDHDRPLFLVVGTYGPHHTFVAPEALFRKYHDRVPEPLPVEGRDWLAGDRKATGIHGGLDAAAIRRVRAAYFGMIEQIDSQVGEVRGAWTERRRRHGRPAQFWYTTDHGESGGNRGLWGKLSFYQDALAVPLLAAGDGIRSGVCPTPVSLIDLPVTFAALGQAPTLPAAQGRSLIPALGGRGLDTVPVMADLRRGGFNRMLRLGSWKYWTSGDEEMLVDLASDPEETRNRASERPDLLAELRTRCWDGVDRVAIRAEAERRAQHHGVIETWGGRIPLEEPDRWTIPRSAWVLPTV